MSEWTAEQLDALTERLSAYLDGASDAAEARELTALLERDATARRILEELREMQSRVGGLPQVSAPPDLSGRVLAAIEREELLEGGMIADVAETSTGRRWLQLLASAALLALAVGVGYYAFFLVAEPTATPARLDDRFAMGEKDEPAPNSTAPAPSAKSRSNEFELRRAGEAKEETAAAPQLPPKADLSDERTRAASIDEADSIRDQVLAKAGAPAASAPQSETAMNDAVSPGVAGGDANLGLGEGRRAGARRARQSSRSVLQQQASVVSNRINIVVADAKVQRELNRQVPELLERNAIVAEASATPEQQMSPKQSLYFAEASNADVQQVLVRADITSLNAFMGDLQTAFPDAQVQPVSNAPGISFEPFELQPGIAGNSMKLRSDPTQRLETDEPASVAGKANSSVRLPPPGEAKADADDESPDNMPQVQRLLQVQNVGALADDEPIVVQFNFGLPPMTAPTATSPSELKP